MPSWLQSDNLQIGRSLGHVGTRLRLGAARRGRVDGAEVAGCILYSARGSHFRSRKLQRPSRGTRWSARWAKSPRRPTTRLWSPSSRSSRKRLQPPALAYPRRAAHRDRHLDRTHPPPPSPTGIARPIDPQQIRDDHDHTTRHEGGLTRTVTSTCSRPQLRIIGSSAHRLIGSSAHRLIGSSAHRLAGLSAVRVRGGSPTAAEWFSGSRDWLGVLRG